ncbi:MAG TPA: cytochrome b/b6 domain-containing protein [Paracoccaceae bacterium]|nr:cytochrome b/b6 domain-containing protein [Paracoccaceae bacterium]
MAKSAKRHAFSTRIWHWINALSVLILFMSGLNISNAHRYLYWGDWGFMPEQAWLEVPRFPGWMTIPSHYSLAAARDWHILFAWVFSLTLLVFMIAALGNGHFRRDLVTRWENWKPAAVWQDVAKHLKFDFSHVGAKFNFLQKASYGVVIFILLPGMIFTGMAISPGMDAAWPWLLDVFGGRQSARSLHFIFAWALCAFTILHVLLVLMTKPGEQIGDMITGGIDDEAA